VKVTSTKSDREIEELVQRHQGAVRGFLAFLGCRPDRIDDLLQDVFLSFLSAHFEDRGEASTRAFLRRIARNLFLKSIQRDRRQIVTLDPVAAESAWVEFEREDGGTGYLTALKRCLEGVRGRAAEVLKLRYDEGVRLTSVASRLGLTESGVKSILVRTKRRLRDCIQRRLAT
jgi:RNA polymerase sigma-70 factor (ECF subfamily)